MSYVVYTDFEIGRALVRVNAKDKPRVLALLGNFVQSGENYTKIPHERRSEFLAELSTLLQARRQQRVRSARGTAEKVFHGEQS
jgi:hypothetical protein